MVKVLSREEQAELIKLENLIGNSPKLNFDDLIAIGVPIWAIKHICKKRKISIEDLGTYEEITETLQTLPIKDLLKFKKPKKAVIDDIMYPNETSMIAGQTGHFKSLFGMYMAICITKGLPFLNRFKTRKQNVLYISAENPMFVDGERVRLILNGLGIRNPKGLHFLPRDKTEQLLDSEFKGKIGRYIVENNIKVIFIDTINPVTIETDDNKAKDVNEVFSEFMWKFVDKFNLNITFLHHTDKKGNEYLGSMKWKGNTDNLIFVERKKDSEEVTLINEKNRWGEWENLRCKILFEDDKINFVLMGQGGKGRKKNPTKKQIAKDWLVRNLVKDDIMTYNEIIDNLISENICQERTGAKAISESEKEGKIVHMIGEKEGYKLADAL